MSDVITTHVSFFKAFYKTKELGIALNYKDLVRWFEVSTESKQTHIKPFEDIAGVIVGETEYWGHCKKVHFTCPSCGYHQWGDLTDWEIPSEPMLWYAECPCVKLWLVSRRAPY